MSQELMEGLRKGEIQALVAQNPKRIGHQAVKVLVAKMKGETVPTVIETGAAVIIKKNLDTPEEGAPATFRPDDCILLTDDIQICIVRSEDISLLEVCGNFTLVHLPERKLLIKRALKECERRLQAIPKPECGIVDAKLLEC
jgi:hypothetical protein